MYYRGFLIKAGTSGDPTTSDSAYDTEVLEQVHLQINCYYQLAGTSYRVRAYAVNSAGTSYGTTLKTLLALSLEQCGFNNMSINIKQIK